MHQIKIFKGIEADVSVLELEVNEWLAKSNATVVHVFGNIAPQSNAKDGGGGLSGSRFAPSDVMLVVVYESA
jgi:hypothetical protein